MAALRRNVFQGKNGGSSGRREIQQTADAMILSRIAKKVLLIHRRDTLRATKIYHEPLMAAENIEFHWNSEVTAASSGEKLTGLRLRNVVTGESEQVECDGVFISVGRIPSTELVGGQLHLDPAGYIVAGETTETNIPGVYAVGDVRTKTPSPDNFGSGRWRLRQLTWQKSIWQIACRIHAAEDTGFTFGKPDDIIEESISPTGAGDQI